MHSREYSPREIAVFEAVLDLAGQGVNLSAVKVQQIADAAGTGKGTLYEYFKSKEEILKGTVDYCLFRELDKIEAITGQARDFEGLMNDAADYILRLVTQRAVAYKVLAGVMHSVDGRWTCGSLGPAAEAARVQADRACRLAVQAGYSAGEPDYFRFCLFTALMGYASALFRANEKGCLTPETERQQRQYFLRLLKKACAEQ